MPDGHFVEKPLPLNRRPQIGESGANKTKTHATEIKANAKLIPQVGLTLHDAKNYKSSKWLFNLINTKKFQCIIPQIRVNKELLLSKNLGEPLLELILAKKYQFCQKQFNGLAKELSYLHQREYVHRDIKLGNMYLSQNNNVVLTDLESAGKIGSFHGNFYTSGTFPYQKFYAANPIYSNHPELAIKQDIYTFLSAMLSAYFAGKLVEIREPQIIEFSQKCIVKAYQKAVLNFLADPINKDIPSLDKLLLN